MGACQVCERNYDQWCPGRYRIRVRGPVAPGQDPENLSRDYRI